MKWEERRCVFDGQVNSGPGVTWIWAEYIIGLENGNYLLSSEDGEDEIDSTDWSKEVAAEDVVKTFLSGPEGGGGWYNFYESEGDRLESLISAVGRITVAAAIADDDRLFDVVRLSKELAELKQELKERLDEERGEWRKSDLISVLETVVIDLGGPPSSPWIVEAIVHETVNPKMVMIEYRSTPSLPGDNEEQFIAEPMEELDEWIDPLIDLDKNIECCGRFDNEDEEFFWQVDKWSLCERDTYKERIKQITLGWTITGCITEELFSGDCEINIDKDDDGFYCSFDPAGSPARLLLRNWDGDTLLMFFLRERSWQEFEAEECVAAIKYLIHDVGIDVNAENDAGESALTIAEAICGEKFINGEEPEEKAIWQSLSDVLRGNE